MDWTSKIGAMLGRFVFACLCTLSLLSCSVSYKFTGGAVDYTQIKTISIADVQNRASVIYPTLAVKLTEDLKDFYTSRTRLEQVPRGGDMSLDVTVTGYDLTPLAVAQDNYAERTNFTITLQVKFVNEVNPKENFERSFKAHRDFAKNTPFVTVQDRLIEEIVEELIKQIYNATIENW